MVAFQGAVDLGYTWVETDIHLSCDGVLVCLHDDTLDRTTNGSGSVSDHTISEIESLDAGYHHGGEQAFRRAGIRIPTLNELVTTYPELRVVVELKQPGLVEPLLDLVNRNELWDRLVVGSFHDRWLADFRRASGGRVATSAGRIETLRAWTAALAGRRARPADALQVPRRYLGLPVVTPRTLAGYHRSGLYVHVWTVNQPREMTRLLDLGVDGLITDRPDLLKGVLEQRSG